MDGLTIDPSQNGARRDGLKEKGLACAKPLSLITNVGDRTSRLYLCSPGLLHNHKAVADDLRAGLVYLP